MGMDDRGNNIHSLVLVAFGIGTTPLKLTPPSKVLSQPREDCCQIAQNHDLHFILLSIEVNLRPQHLNQPGGIGGLIRLNGFTVREWHVSQVLLGNTTRILFT